MLSGAHMKRQRITSSQLIPGSNTRLFSACWDQERTRHKIMMLWVWMSDTQWTPANGSSSSPGSGLDMVRSWRDNEQKGEKKKFLAIIYKISPEELTKLLQDLSHSIMPGQWISHFFVQLLCRVWSVNCFDYVCLEDFNEFQTLVLINYPFYKLSRVFWL